MTYSELIRSHQMVLVEFYASWCPHCQRMMPVVEQVKERLAGRVAVVQLDIDENQQYAAEAGADQIPVFILYRDGKEVWRRTGETDLAALLADIERHIV